MALISNIKGKSDLPRIIEKLPQEVISTTKIWEGYLQITLGTYKKESCIFVEYTRDFGWGMDPDLYIDVGKIKQYKLPSLIHIRPQSEKDFRSMKIDIHFKNVEKTGGQVNFYTFTYDNSFIKPVYDVDNIKKFNNCVFYNSEFYFSIRNAHSDIQEVLFNGSNDFIGKSSGRMIHFYGFYNPEKDERIDLSKYAYKIKYIGI